MPFEEWLAAIWEDPRSRSIIFIGLMIVYYGMLALGYLIIVGLLFGTSALIFAVAGLAIVGGLYVLARVFRDRVRAVWKNLLRRH